MNIPCAHVCESNMLYIIHILTLPKTNIAPENRPSHPTFSGTTTKVGGLPFWQRENTIWSMPGIVGSTFQFWIVAHFTWLANASHLPSTPRLRTISKWKLSESPNFHNFSYWYPQSHSTLSCLVFRRGCHRHAGISTWWWCDWRLRHLIWKNMTRKHGTHFLHLWWQSQVPRS